MKKTLLTLTSVLFCAITFAQTVPQGINYQAVARDANGAVLMNQGLTIQFSIISDITTSAISWQETHQATTSDYGLFTAVIGQGTNTTAGFSATFDVIDWGAANHYLKVEIDDGNGFVDMGTTQLLSVPYALQAGNTAILPSGSSEQTLRHDGNGWVSTSNLSNDGYSIIMGNSIAINHTNANANVSSILDITSNDKGILIPRMTEAQKLAIMLPATGLLVYQTSGSDPGFYFFNGFTWEILSTGAQGPQGPAGNIGPIGPTGLTGAQGPVGPAGADGIDGINGTDGQQGLDGNDGVGIAQTISLSGSMLTLSDNGGSVNLDNTDNQDLNLSGNILSLTNDPSTVNLSPLVDELDFSGGGTGTMYATSNGDNIVIGNTYVTGSEYGLVNGISNAKTISVQAATNYTDESPSILELQGSSSTDGDEIGVINFVQKADFGSNYNFARISAHRENSNATYSSLRFYTRKGSTITEAMRIDEDANVGIGTTTPSEKLDVDGGGSIEVDGEYTYESAKTRYMSFPGTSFRTYSSSYQMQSSGWVYSYFNSGSGSLAYATTPLHLPDGAVVTNLECYIWDQTASVNVGVMVYRQSLGSTAITNMCTVESANTASYTIATLLTRSTSTNFPINNSAYAYYLVFKGQQNTSNTRIYGAKVTYTVTQAD